MPISSEQMTVVRELIGDDTLSENDLAGMVPALVGLVSFMLERGVATAESVEGVKLSRAEVREDLRGGFKRWARARKLSLKAPDDDGDWEAEAKRQAEINNAVPVL